LAAATAASVSALTSIDSSAIASPIAAATAVDKPGTLDKADKPKPILPIEPAEPGPLLPGPALLESEEFPLEPP
jgi:hypothetical protein